MNKYRFCSGLAIFPEHDMKMLGEMSRSGWHLVGFSKVGFMYKLEKGEPIPYIYSVNFEKNVNDNMIDIYRESGWETIVSNSGYQIFRALEGTPPIFSDKQSEIDILKEQRNFCGKGSLISLGVLLIFILTVYLTNIHNGLILLGIIPLVCFVFTFFPFIGSMFHIRRVKNKKE